MMSRRLQNLLTTHGVERYRCFTTNANCNKVLTITEVRNTLMEMVGMRKQWGEITAGSQGVLQKVVDSQAGLPHRKPSDSFIRAVIPLSQLSCRDKYLFYNKGIRFGRLLEDFDTLAGFICYNHNKNPELGDDQKSPYVFVTALVDRIEYSQSPALSAYKDICMNGQVTWVGTSSMECTMHMEQEVEGVMQRIITAKYLFVARNPQTNKAGIANPLKPETPEEIAAFKLGEENRKRRQQEGDKSLLKTPPSEDERLIIHDLFLSTVDLKTGTMKIRVKPENTVWMEESKVKTLVICHPENRNLYNKIFGGFLMMKAYELAWANVSLYTKTRPGTCKCVDDIVFKQPVEVGSLLFFSSQIVYTNGSDIQVHVHAEVLDPEKGTRDTTNDFQFTFDTGLPNLPRIIPKTYAEAMLYLVGKRHYES
uniref:HotDog ACOT-type domain-containing protein n=1 Tax=Arion vulgaris TaxID=1028688 RepID=A0A0B6ZLN7_9EUPU